MSNNWSKKYQKALSQKRTIEINRDAVDVMSPTSHDLIRKMRSELVSVGQAQASRRSSGMYSRASSGSKSRNRILTTIDEKKTKVIGGHAMAVRDYSQARYQGKIANLNDISKLNHFRFIKNYFCGKIVTFCAF